MTPYSFDHHKKILITEYAVSQEVFISELKAWQLKFDDSETSRKAFLSHMFQKMADTITHKFPNADNLYDQLRPIYLILWRLSLLQNKNAAHFQKLINYCELKRAEKARYKTLAMYVCHSCCDACEAIDGLVLPVDDALTQQPLPQEGCTRPLGCLCTYGIQGERDLDGKLIMKPI